MSRALTASDRSALIRLASSLPKGSEERKAILKGLSKTARDLYPGIEGFEVGRIGPDFEGDWSLVVGSDGYGIIAMLEYDWKTTWEKRLSNDTDVLPEQIIEWEKTYTRVLKQVARGASPEKFGFKSMNPTR